MNADAENKENNDLKNLVAIRKSAHMRFHMMQRKRGKSGGLRRNDS